MEKSCDILKRAAEAYKASELSYRDCLLACGRLLHEFVLSYVSEQEHLSVRQRHRHGLSRRRAVALAMESLDADTRKINLLISTAMAADLLSEGGQTGGLRWGVIRRFARFIYRRVNRDPGGRAAMSEQWLVKPEFDGAAQELFRRAVREGLPQTRVEEFVMQLGENMSRNGEHYKRVRMTREREELLDGLKKMAGAGAARDVAEILFEAVKASDDPLAVASRLLEMAKALPKRRRHSFAEAK